MLTVGILSARVFALQISLALIAPLVVVAVLVFRERLQRALDWLERQFLAGFQAPRSDSTIATRFAPWDAHLVGVVAHPNSALVGKRLVDLRLRERFGLNVIGIKRGDALIITPKRSEQIFPHDTLLLLGTDEELESIRPLIELSAADVDSVSDIDEYRLRQMTIEEGSPLAGVTIHLSGIRERFHSMVVGVERDGTRILNPTSDFILQEGDTLWLVGQRQDLRELREFMH